MGIMTQNLSQLADTLGKSLLEKRLKISIAESCTGGLVGKTITDVAGCSAWFECSLVTYSNEAKIEFLGVKELTLNKFGAVSEEVCCEMATGVRKKASTDLGLSVSGIAGPEGGSVLKPVGTVCFGFSLPNRSYSSTRIFEGGRDEIRIRSTQFLLIQLLEYLMTD